MRGGEETPMTSKLEALDVSEPVWLRHRLSEEHRGRRTANGERVSGFRISASFEGDPKYLQNITMEIIDW